MIYILSSYQNHVWDLSFYFYSEIILNYLLENNILCKKINSISTKIKENDILIIFTPYFKIFDLSLIKKNRVILINSEPITVNRNKIIFDKILKNFNIKYIIDYSKINIKMISKIKKNYYYSKFIYSNIIENYFKNLNISNTNKDIDFLIFGTHNERREKITSKLKENYKVLYLQTKNYSEFYKTILRSKIILIILSRKENNNIDFYRLMILITLKKFFIHELVKNRLDFTNKIIFSKYKKLTNIAIDYLNKSDDYKNEITLKLYNYCKKNYSFDLDKSNIINYLK